MSSHGCTAVIYPFVSRWTWSCLHFLAIVSNAAVNVCVHVFVWTYVFEFSWVYAQEWSCWVLWSLLCIPLRNCHTFLPQRHCFAFSPAVREGSDFSTASPTLVTVRLLIIVILVEDSYFLERQYFLHTNYLDFRKREPLFKGSHPLSPTFPPTLAQREKIPLEEEE